MKTKDMTNSKNNVYSGGRIFKQSKRYVMTHPKNSWDMNYHLYDKVENIEYLIDIDDIGEYETDMCCEDLKDFSWRQYAI